MLDRYLEEIGKEELLTEEQERELSMQIRQGNKDAVRRLATANLHFVVAVAQKYKNKGVDVADLVCEGNIALMRAAERYDSDKGCRFVSYAAPFVHKSIERAIAEQTALYSVPRCEAIPVEKKRSRALSADAPLGGRANMSLLNVLVNNDSPSADGNANKESFNDAFMNVLARLDERERKVVVMHFGIGCERMTFAEIGQELGLKRERVRQIRDKALRKISKEKEWLKKEPGD